MPKTKFQEVIFSLLMAFAMVYAMELYNLAIEAGGLKNELFLKVFNDLILMGFIVIILEKIIAGPLAKKFAFRILNSKEDKQIFIILGISIFTVCMMCPMMSFVATLIFKNAGTEILSVWIETTAKNFPMALCWQLFFAGPLVRFIFRSLFSKQLSESQELKSTQISQ